tara:strand:+ start:1004 stop:2020 length:1017 start_codon:yes stop_codon:yes gene_type:complete
MGNNKVNITDIADKTGLSISTVSRVLNGKAEQYRIGIKSQQKIRKIAKELNYIPNQFAANLKSGKSKTIVLIVPSLNNPFFAEIASNINSEVRKYGYTTMIADSDENISIEKMELKQLLSKNIEGLIIVPCGNQWKHIKILQDQGFPLICIDRYFEDLTIPYVSTDNYEGAYLATKHLIDHGHSKIFCIQGVQKSTPNKLRVKGFKSALNEFGINSFPIVGNDFSFKNGYIETKLLLKNKQKPTAIFALSNTIAMGCMKAIKEENLLIPQDISLITFDDHPYLEYLATPISCVAQPIAEISRIATKRLFSKIDNLDATLDNILLKPTLKIRESVRSYF